MTNKEKLKLISAFICDYYSFNSDFDEEIDHGVLKSLVSCIDRVISLDCGDDETENTSSCQSCDCCSCHGGEDDA